MTDDSAVATLAVVLVGALAFGGIGGYLWYEQTHSVQTYESARRPSSPRR